MIHAYNWSHHGPIRTSHGSVKNYYPTYILARVYELDFNGLGSTKSYLIRMLGRKLVTEPRLP